MSDRDKDREGGGLAVIVLAGFLALLIVVAAGGGWLYLRQVQRAQIDELMLQEDLAAHYASQAEEAQAAAAEAAAKAGEGTVEEAKTAEP